MCWTQYAGHGPGAELAGRGVRAVGVDLSPVMVGKARERWQASGARFECAEVLGFLAEDDGTYDAVYSIFGAAWFTDPARLFPLVARRLNPGGVLAFSHPPAIPGAYGPQGMYKGGFAGPAMFTYRYSCTPEGWERLLLRSGLSRARVEVLAAPVEGHIGTLIARAWAPGTPR